MSGGPEPFFDRDGYRIVEAFKERDVFADRLPWAHLEDPCTIVDQRTVEALMAEEIVLRHIVRMGPGDRSDLVVPDKRAEPGPDSFLIDQLKSFAFEAAKRSGIAVRRSDHRFRSDRGLGAKVHRVRIEYLC